MRYVLILCLLAMPVFANDADGPIQDERLNVAACLSTVNALPASYRAQLYDACTDIPRNLCLVRGTVDTCLTETAQQMKTFYQKSVRQFPETIAGSTLAKRSYDRAMNRIADTFASGAHCDGEAICTYDAHATALKSLFRQARRAKINLIRPAP